MVDEMKIIGKNSPGGKRRCSKTIIIAPVLVWGAPGAENAKNAKPITPRREV
jgi:hypothetical protein